MGIFLEEMKRVKPIFKKIISYIWTWDMQEGQGLLDFGDLQSLGDKSKYEANYD
jgi:hypothetical protein